MTRMWRAAVVAWAFVVCLCLTVGAQPADSAIPAVIKAEPAPEWDARFAGKDGWIGGDGVYSIELGRGRVLWLFGDTILGSVKDGQRRGAEMVNNTVGVQSGIGKDVSIRFVAGKAKDGRPAAVFTPADGKGMFWPQAAIRVSDRLFVFLPQIEKTNNPGVFGFKHIGQWLAVVENPDDEPEKWRVQYHKVPLATYGPDRERSWGSAVLADREHLYVYGYDEERGKGLGKRRLTVARVPAEKLNDFGAWRFRTSHGWSAKATDAAPLGDGLATEFSITRMPVGKGYVAVYTENGIGPNIVGRFADAPEGPWSAPVLLCKCPEMGKDRGVFSYAAKAHAWAATGNELVISYCVNAWELARVFRDEKVYRPQFMRVVLGPAK